MGSVVRHKDGSLHYRAAWMDWIKPYSGKAPTLRPTRRRDAESVVKHIHRSIEKELSNRRDYEQDACRQRVGVKSGKHWIYSATDGYRALFVPSTQEGKSCKLKLHELHENYIELDESFSVALRRIGKLSGDKAVGLSMPHEGELIMRSYDAGYSRSYYGGPDQPCYAEESIDVTGNALLDDITLNWEFLMPALGLWPMRLYWKDAKTHIVLRPPNDDFRFIMMPMDAPVPFMREVEEAA